MEIGLLGKVFLTGVLSFVIGVIELRILEKSGYNIFIALTTIILFWGGLLSIVITVLIGIWRM